MTVVLRRAATASSKHTAHPLLEQAAQPWLAAQSRLAQTQAAGFSLRHGLTKTGGDNAHTARAFIRIYSCAFNGPTDHTTVIQRRAGDFACAGYHLIALLSDTSAAAALRLHAVREAVKQMAMIRPSG